VSRIQPSTIPGVRHVVARIDQAVRWRAEEQLSTVHERMDAIERRLADVDQRLRVVGQIARGAKSEVGRVASQAAALETRVEDIRQGSQLVAGSSAEVDDARQVVDDVRREHQRVRARLTAISWYEDRIRKLEAQVGELSGDMVVLSTTEPLVNHTTS
jgi:chromosome segregation ATPase